MLLACTSAAALAPQVERRLPLDAEGRVAVAEVVRVLLPWLDPRDRRDLEVTTEAAKRISGTLGEHLLRSWNIQGKMAGVSFSAQGQELVVLVDTRKVERHSLMLRSLVRRLARTPGTGAATLSPRGSPPGGAPTAGAGLQPSPLPQPVDDRYARNARSGSVPANTRPAIEPGLIRVSDSREGGPPVVLVHGLDGHVSSFAAAATELGRRGYDVYVLQWSAGQSVPEVAAFLGQQLRELAARLGVRKSRSRRKLSLVTTSLGGVIAAWYLEQDPLYGGEVGRLIACCPPFSGVPLASYHPRAMMSSLMGSLVSQGLGPLFVFSDLGDAAADVVPGSPVLRTLNRGKRRAGVSYSILAGDKPLLPDEVLVMAEALVAQGAQDAQGPARDLMEWLTTVAREAREVGAGRGDGVVPLASTELGGVRDRVVLPVNHMEFLSTPRRAQPGATVPALAEVIERLPRAR